MGTYAEEIRRPPAGARAGAAAVTREAIQEYLKALSARGRSTATVKMYTAKLRAFYDYLPPDKLVFPETLSAWRDILLKHGYSPGTVNTHLSAANGLLEHMGHRDLQLLERLETEPDAQPELTRTEYLLLLQTAKALERERTYLMVKAFALTGVRVGELALVTAEAVETGRLLLTFSGERRYVPIPGCLRQELSDYMARQGIRSGPVFLSRNGHVLRRTQVTSEIQALAHDARVEASKCTPRCLRKLCLVTQTEIEHSVRLLAEQSYERMLDTEQLAVGWDRA